MEGPREERTKEVSGEVRAGTPLERVLNFPSITSRPEGMCRRRSGHRGLNRDRQARDYACGRQAQVYGTVCRHLAFLGRDGRLGWYCPPTLATHTAAGRFEKHAPQVVSPRKRHEDNSQIESPCLGLLMVTE
jgi:hypothetical protein